MAKKKSGNIFLWIVMLLLIAGLAGFGATSFSGGTSKVATVGDKTVETNDYVRAFDAQVRAFRQNTRSNITYAQARSLGLDGQALGQLIGATALENEAAQLGLSIGDENVSREIMASPTFRSASGEFDRGTYELALRENGISPRDYEERVRGETASGILRAAVASGLTTPDIFIDTLFNYALEQRDVTWARLDAEDLVSPIDEPTEETLRQFHQDNPEPFTQGETRVIDYAWLTPDMIVDEIEVDEAQVRALYDERLAEYVQPERRLVERLVFTSDTAASDAKAEIDAGTKTFDDLVADRGLTLDDVDLGEVSEADLGAAGGDVFALQEPDVVGPLPSDLGPALFRMNGILSAQETTFDEARDDLEAEAAGDRARRLIRDEIGRIEDLLAGGATPETLGERTDMETGQIDWRDDVSDGIAAYDSFRTSAAAASIGDFPEVVELDDGGIFVLSLKEIRPPELRPFEEVREEVLAAWETAEIEAALVAQAEGIADRLREGAEMAGLGLDLETDRGLTRDGFVEGTPAAFVETVFGMEANGVAVLSAAGDAWIVRLDDVRAPSADSGDAALLRARFSAEAQQAMSTSLLDAYRRSVISNTDISINQQALNAINAQLN